MLESGSFVVASTIGPSIVRPGETMRSISARGSFVPIRIFRLRTGAASGWGCRARSSGSTGS